jgi:hypothetical protein
MRRTPWRIGTTHKRSDGSAAYTIDFVDGEMAGESWPYLWIGLADGAAIATIDWRELQKIARRVEALELRDAVPPPRRKRKAVTP